VKDSAGARMQTDFIQLAVEGAQQFLREPSGTEHPAAQIAIMDNDAIGGSGWRLETNICHMIALWDLST